LTFKNLKVTFPTIPSHNCTQTCPPFLEANRGKSETACRIP